MAKEHPRYAETEWPEWEYREYPMMVYPGAPDQKKPYDEKGKVLRHVIVNSDDELRAVMGFDEPEEGEEVAPIPKPAAKKATLVPSGSPGGQRIETPADEKTAMIAEAESLGITQFDKSWSPARMQDAIDTFKKAAENVV